MAVLVKIFKATSKVSLLPKEFSAEAMFMNFMSVRKKAVLVNFLALNISV